MTALSFFTAHSVAAFFKASASSSFAVIPCSTMSLSASPLSARYSASAARAASSDVIPPPFFLVVAILASPLANLVGLLLRQPVRPAGATTSRSEIGLVAEPVADRPGRDARVQGDLPDCEKPRLEILHVVPGFGLVGKRLNVLVVQRLARVRVQMPRRLQRSHASLQRIEPGELDLLLLFHLRHSDAAFLVIG